MSDRLDLAHQFLAQTDWADARLDMLAGDASNRKYYRLTQNVTKETAVLMDAPPNTGEDIRPFMRIATYLSGVGLSAPRIFAHDDAKGFLLLEDLGDDLFARVVAANPSLEHPLYLAATGALIELHKHVPLPELDTYSPETMADMACLAFDWYAAAAGTSSTSARQNVHDRLVVLLRSLETYQPVLIQRDYHAENLLWLPDRPGIARVGLLDFQDAMLGHCAYDLVSLLQDARRDVSAEIETIMIDHYVQSTGADSKQFQLAYRCLGAQRNLRILGVFARLCMRDGKQGYVDLIPRVWDHLQADLRHPALSEIATCLAKTLPAPTPDILKTLKNKCATLPAQ